MLQCVYCVSSIFSFPAYLQMLEPALCATGGPYWGIRECISCLKCSGSLKACLCRRSKALAQSANLLHRGVRSMTAYWPPDPRCALSLQTFCTADSSVGFIHSFRMRGFTSFSQHAQWNCCRRVFSHKLLWNQCCGCNVMSTIVRLWRTLDLQMCCQTRWCDQPCWMAKACLLSLSLLTCHPSALCSC